MFDIVTWVVCRDWRWSVETVDLSDDEVFPMYHAKAWERHQPLFPFEGTREFTKVEAVLTAYIKAHKYHTR